MIQFKLTGIKDGNQTIVSGDWRAVTKFMGKSFEKMTVVELAKNFWPLVKPAFSLARSQEPTLFLFLNESNSLLYILFR
jgi:hypothetical protein